MIPGLTPEQQAEHERQLANARSASYAIGATDMIGVVIKSMEEAKSAVILNKRAMHIPKPEEEN